MGEVDDFAVEEGRRPRILAVTLSGDGRDAKGMATAFADLGFDVDLGPLSQTPEEAARQAIENDVHVVGASGRSGDYKTLIPRLIRALKDQGAPDITVICGGDVPPDDYDTLHSAGVGGIYGFDVNFAKAAAEVIGLVRAARPAN